MTMFNPNHPLILAMRGWDDVRPTSECLHCHGTGLAPGDGLTECGFCEPTQKAADHANQRVGLPKVSFDVV